MVQPNGHGTQEHLPGLPPSPPSPPTLKNMARLMATVDQLYPADSFTAVDQWERFNEICEVAFKGGIRFIVPLVDWQVEYGDDQYGE